jgi:phosphoribosylformylglycinamidine (FGAM) synthase-like enzyme
MFNDFSGFDSDNNPVRISVPPTLLISSIGIHDDVAKAVSIDAKFGGDFVFVVGETFPELGGSEYFAFLDSTGNTVPKLDSKKAKSRYQRLTAAITKEIVASAYAVNHGGLGIALAKVSIAGSIGMEIAIPSGLRPDYYLFSESLGRFVVTVSKDNRKDFEEMMGGDAIMLGTVCGGALRITGQKLISDLQIEELETAYKSPFLGY